MFDTLSEVFRGVTQDGGSVWTSISSSGIGQNVNVKDAFGQVTQTFQNLDLSQANDIVSQILGR